MLKNDIGEATPAGREGLCRQTESSVAFSEECEPLAYLETLFVVG